jgi:hypothetical protein
MLSRSAAFSLLFLFAATLVHSPAQSQLPAMKSFKELDFDMNFIYPADFVSAKPGVSAPDTYTIPVPRPNKPRCVQTPLSVGSPATGNAALVFSIIDDACPTILHDAQKVGAFAQAQIIRQLQSYGTPTITMPSRSYTLDGRSAAVVLASATPTTNGSTATPVTTYAAKVCMFAREQAYTFGKVPSQLTAANSIICFDFTTAKRDQLAPLLALPVVFGDLTPRSLVPAALLR